MADKVAFALKAEYADDFNGGTVAVPPDYRTLNFGARLRDADHIVVSDPQEIEALRGVEALKEIAVPKGAAKGGSA